MSEYSLIDALVRWLSVHGFPDYEQEGDLVCGSYGLVFLMHSKHSARRIAVKTLDPNRLPKDPKMLAQLQREIAMSLRLPEHPNVLAAGHFKQAKIPVGYLTSDDKPELIEIPVMQMARMDGSLEDWIGNDCYPYVARLSALAQAFNGLAHLYANGIEGHGDLKPSNLLYTDISRKHGLSSGSWLSDYPNIIKVADLGWANAWVDYGYTSKALRQYIAPERLAEKPVFVPEKSDVFSMGMITAELIQGHHPSPNLKKAQSHDSKWLRQIAEGKWNLEAIHSDRIRGLILRCVDPQPANRPSPAEAIQTICEELKEVHKLDIGPTLEYWTQSASEPHVPYISTLSGEIERIIKTLGLGSVQESKSIERLRKILEEIQPNDIYSLEDWAKAAAILLDFLERFEGHLNGEEAGRLRQQARKHLVETLGIVDHRVLAQMASALHKEDWERPFERFSHLIGHLAVIADIDFEQAYRGEWNLSQLALAGFAFDIAGRTRLDQNAKRDVIEYLDISIDLSLIEAVPYFFRALRKEDILALQALGYYSESNVCKLDVIQDLKIACQLAPDWNEPKMRLRSIIDN